jgi:hypothetical protein
MSKKKKKTEKKEGLADFTGREYIYIYIYIYAIKDVESCVKKRIKQGKRFYIQRQDFKGREKKKDRRKYND